MTCEEIKIKIANMSYPLQSSYNHDYVLYWVGEGKSGRERGKKKEKKQNRVTCNNHLILKNNVSKL